MKKTELHRHFLITLAFILCLIIFVLPTAADLYYVQLMTSHFLNAFLGLFICLAIVLVPLIIGFHVVLFTWLMYDCLIVK